MFENCPAHCWIFFYMSEAKIEEFTFFCRILAHILNISAPPDIFSKENSGSGQIKFSGALSQTYCSIYFGLQDLDPNYQMN